MAYIGNSPGDLDCPSDSNRKTGLQGWGAQIICFSLSVSLSLSSTFRPGSAIDGSYQSVVDQHFKKCTLLQCQCVQHISGQVLIQDTIFEDTIFTFPTGFGTTTLRDLLSNMKVQPFAGQRQFLHLSVILRPRVMVGPWESNLRPPSLQSSN